MAGVILSFRAVLLAACATLVTSSSSTVRADDVVAIEINRGVERFSCILDPQVQAETWCADHEMGGDSDCQATLSTTISKKQAEVCAYRMEDWLERPIKDWLELLQWRMLSSSTYHGVMTWKFPFDIWMYRELLVRELPTVLIEIGNFAGGSALFFADLFDTLGHWPGRIIAVDIDHSNLHERAKSHERITWIEADASDAFRKVASLVDAKHDKVLVIEDASHRYKETLDIMKTYGTLVTNGSYMIIEDTALHNGVKNDFFCDPGAYASVQDFMNNGEYKCGWVIDRDMERYLISWNPRGFLRKVHPTGNCSNIGNMGERHHAYASHAIPWTFAELDPERFFSLLDPSEFIDASLLAPRVSLPPFEFQPVPEGGSGSNVAQIKNRALQLCAQRIPDMFEASICGAMLLAKTLSALPAAAQMRVPMLEWELDTPVHEVAPYRSAARDIKTVGISVLGSVLKENQVAKLRKIVTSRDSYRSNEKQRTRYDNPFCADSDDACRAWDDSFLELARHPDVLSRVENILGDDCIVDSTAITVQWPGEGMFGPHVDRPFDNKGGSSWKYSSSINGAGVPPLSYPISVQA